MTQPDRDPTQPSTCRSCGASIIWCEWERSKKKMPCDAMPVPEGDVVLCVAADRSRMIVRKYDDSVHAGRRRFISHFGTCPNANQHRRTP